MGPWNPDFEEFFALLTSTGVEFLLVGGVAYNHYAPPRATKDIDIWVRPTDENVARLLRAIATFGFPTSDLDADDLVANPRILMLGRIPNRIDILMHPDGVDWESAASQAVDGAYGSAPMRIAGIATLIANKRAAGRPRDLADVAALRDVMELDQAD